MVPSLAIPDTAAALNDRLAHRLGCTVCKEVEVVLAALVEALHGEDALHYDSPANALP